MPNIAMWGKALKVIPKISHEEWNTLDVISRWLISTRAAVFVMTAMSAVYGGLLAYSDGNFNFIPFLLSFIGLVFAHATNNLVNDWTDYKKGVDKDNYFRGLYGPQTLEHKFFTEKQMWTYILSSFVIALSCGVYLALTTPTFTMYLILIGIFFIAFYTYPLKYIGLGELTVLFVWGPLMVAGTYYVTSGGIWSWNVAIISLIYSIGPTSVLFGKHTDKLKLDKEKKIYTLPVILGERASRYTVILMWTIQYILVGYMIYISVFTPVMAIVLLSLPTYFKAFKIYSKPRPTSAPDGYENIWPLFLVRHAFNYNKRFGSIFLLALIIDIAVRQLGIL